MSLIPKYVQGHKLLEGKTVVVTAAAGTGIGFSTAKRCAEEGAKAIVISDIHERRLAEAADAIEKETGLRPTPVTDGTAWSSPSVMARAPWPSVWIRTHSRAQRVRSSPCQKRTVPRLAPMNTCGGRCAAGSSG